MTQSAHPTKLVFPFAKKDLHYDPARKEVSLSVENFDALVKFMQELVDRAETAEDNAGVFRYRLRESQATAGILAAAFEQVKDQLRGWLAASHTIRELATRTGIPYATCYRIVKERLEKNESVDSGDLQKIAAVMNEDLQKTDADLDDDIVLLPRPGETLRPEDVYHPPEEPALFPNEGAMSDAELRQGMKEGKIVLKLVDVSTGRAKPVTVKSVRLQPAARSARAGRAGRKLYTFTGQLDFSQALNEAPQSAQSLEKAES
jgi:hypothetical protein